MDDCDRASLETEAMRALQLRKVTDQVAQAGAFECEACGEELSAERRAAMPSARTCVECQEAAERRRRAFKGR